MNFISSVIAAINYNPKTMVLTISFKDNTIYDYYGVPESIAKNFLTATSKGKFYAHHIKGFFNSQRIR